MNTGKNEILEDVLKAATDDITEKLYSLLRGERVIARIDQNVVYRSLAQDRGLGLFKMYLVTHLFIPYTIRYSSAGADFFASGMIHQKQGALKDT